MQSIHLTAYSPLGSPDSAESMGRGADVPDILQNDVVLDIAKKLGKEPGQVCSLPHESMNVSGDAHTYKAGRMHMAYVSVGLLDIHLLCLC